MALMKSGTRIPPPVHARIIETSLYETEDPLGAAAKTLLPDDRVKEQHVKYWARDKTMDTYEEVVTHHASRCTPTYDHCKKKRSTQVSSMIVAIEPTLYQNAAPPTGSTPAHSSAATERNWYTHHAHVQHLLLVHEHEVRDVIVEHPRRRVDRLFDFRFPHGGYGVEAAEEANKRGGNCDVPTEDACVPPQRSLAGSSKY